MEHQRKLFQQRGYSEDLLPKTQSQRTWGDAANLLI